MVTSPTVSPRTTGEKHGKHHHRRKSTQSTHHHHVSERKAGRPALSRRATPQYISRVSSSVKVKDAAKERDDSDGESFPQYCTICETQLQNPGNNELYCSDACRLQDLNHASYPSTPPLTPHLGPPYIDSRLSACDLDRDIIPRASPTQARPRSYYMSESDGTTDSDPYTSSSKNSKSSTALESLRELATALPPVRPPSDTDLPSGAQSPREKPASVMWSYMPFSTTSKSSALYPKSYSAVPSPYITPGTSYSGGYAGYDRQAKFTSTSYGGMGLTMGSSSDLYALGGGIGMERPLPPRYGPSSHRPRSMDLVTPYPGVGN